MVYMYVICISPGCTCIMRTKEQVLARLQLVTPQQNNTRVAVLPVHLFLDDQNILLFIIFLF